MADKQPHVCVCCCFGASVRTETLFPRRAHLCTRLCNSMMPHSPALAHRWTGQQILATNAEQEAAGSAMGMPPLPLPAGSAGFGESGSAAASPLNGGGVNSNGNGTGVGDLNDAGGGGRPVQLMAVAELERRCVDWRSACTMGMLRASGVFLCVGVCAALWVWRRRRSVLSAVWVL